MLSSRGSARAEWATLVVFGAFTGYALRAAQDGRASCGCLGSVPVSPWFMLVVDGLAVGLLTTTADRRAWPRRLAAAAAAGAVGWWVSVPPSLPSQNSQEGEWRVAVGERIPGEVVDGLPSGIERGEWTLVFYRDDCKECQRLLQRLAVAVQRREARLALDRFVLVRVAGFGGASPRGLPHPLAMAWQARTEAWVGTPLVAGLREGRVAWVEGGERFEISVAEGDKR